MFMNICTYILADNIYTYMLNKNIYIHAAYIYIYIYIYMLNTYIQYIYVYIYINRYTENLYVVNIYMLVALRYIHTVLRAYLEGCCRVAGRGSGDWTNFAGAFSRQQSKTYTK